MRSGSRFHGPGPASRSSRCSGGRGETHEVDEGERSRRADRSPYILDQRSRHAGWVPLTVRHQRRGWCAEQYRASVVFGILVGPLQQTDQLTTLRATEGGYRRGHRCGMVTRGLYAGQLPGKVAAQIR